MNQNNIYFLNKNKFLFFFFKDKMATEAEDSLKVDSSAPDNDKKHPFDSLPKRSLDKPFIPLILGADSFVGAAVLYELSHNKRASERIYCAISYNFPSLLILDYFSFLCFQKGTRQR